MNKKAEEKIIAICLSLFITFFVGLILASFSMNWLAIGILALMIGILAMEVLGEMVLSKSRRFL